MTFKDSDLIRFLETYRKMHDLPGVSIALIRNGELESTGAAGHADLFQQVTLDPDARFPIFSVTKTLIAVTLLMLMREHPVSLDDEIGKHLPDLHLPAALTLRRVLTHTSGLPDYGGSKAYQEALKAHPEQPWTVQQYLDVIQTSGLHGGPDVPFQYSNVGYLILKLLIEQISGRSLGETLKVLLFDPLGLTRTRTAETLDDMADLTPGFSRFWTGKRQDVRPFYHPGWVAHGVVTSTAAELARLIDAIFTPQVLHPQEIGQMLQGVVVADHHPIFTLPGYGLGLMMDALRNEVMGHGGGGPGYSIGALHFPDHFGDSITCVVMVNQEGDRGLDLAHQVVMRQQ